VITTYSYDAANQLVAEESASGRITYTYDPNGNMTVRDNAGARTTYTWDAENRLIGADLATGGPVTMTYDAEGLRRRLETPTEDTRFVWDGQNVLLETDEQGATRASYTLAPRRYGDLLSQRRGSDSRFYLFDGLGSTDRLLDEDEAVTDSYTYEAFGTARALSGSTANAYRYVGRLGYQFDGATGLHYIRATHYDAAIGAFTSRDWADRVHSRVYARNRPPSVTDPSGQHPDLPPDWQTVLWKAIGEIPWCRKINNPALAKDAAERERAEWLRSRIHMIVRCIILAESNDDPGCITPWKTPRGGYHGCDYGLMQIPLWDWCGTCAEWKIISPCRPDPNNMNPQKYLPSEQNVREILKYWNNLKCGVGLLCYCLFNDDYGKPYDGPVPPGSIAEVKQKCGYLKLYNALVSETFAHCWRERVPKGEW
jgi:RHS repeat-associated protein